MDSAIGQVLTQAIGVPNALADPVTAGWLFHLLATRVLVVAVLALEALILGASTKITTPKKGRARAQEAGLGVQAEWFVSPERPIQRRERT